MADLSGYFVIGFDTSNIAKICKYTFSSLSAQCQTINSISIGYGHLMISNSQFFVLGIASTSPKNLKMYKITFLLTSVDWANQIVCTAAQSISYSESVLSSDRSTIYTFFLYGPSKYLYFAGLSLSDGSATTARYTSSETVSEVWGSTLNADYVVATIHTPTSLVIYNISSSTITIYSFSGLYLFGWGVEPSSGR